LHATGIGLATFNFSWFAARGIICPESVRRSVPKRQAEFLAGRLCARASLAELKIRDAPIGIGEMREPVWPAGVSGSISHCADFAVAATAWTREHAGLGLDVECIADVAGNLPSGGSVIGSSERLRLRSMEILPMPTLRTLVFSAKESFFKAVSARVGRHFDFDAIEVLALDIHYCQLLFRVRADFIPGLPPGTLCRVAYSTSSTHVLTLFIC